MCGDRGRGRIRPRISAASVSQKMGLVVLAGVLGWQSRSDRGGEPRQHLRPLVDNQNRTLATPAGSQPGRPSTVYRDDNAAAVILAKGLAEQGFQWVNQHLMA